MPSLSAHLKRLEAESIEIIREVAAEFDNPVMLYSIGKDSGVMLHLAIISRCSIISLNFHRVSTWSSGNGGLDG